MSRIQKRNQQILQLRKEGRGRVEVARLFKLSKSRVWLIERRAATDKAMAERRSRLLEEIRAVDDPQRTWPVNDLVDAIELTVITRKRLLDHFSQTGRSQISLRELMDMCLDSQATAGEFTMPPLLSVRGIGQCGFWSVANGMTEGDLGGRCNAAWRETLAMVKLAWRVTGAAPYSTVR